MADVERFLMVPEQKYNNLLIQIKQLRASVNDNHSQISTPSQTDSSRVKESNNNADVEDVSEMEYPERRKNQLHADIDTYNSDTDVDETIDDANNSLPERIILTAIPRQYRSRSKRLLEIIKDHVKWDSKGQILKDDNNIIQGSHISDLLRDIQIPYKNIEIPGRAYFKGVLSKLHIPKCLVAVDCNRNKDNATAEQSKVVSLPKPKAKRKSTPESKTDIVKEWLSY